VALLLLLLSPSRASAQDYDDPPSRVARLSYTQGYVSFQPAGTGDWVDAIVNRPLTTGDQLWTDRGSRAALHIGSASIHLSENTGFSFLNLTDTTAQLQLTTGTLRIRVKRLGDSDNFEVDTPNLAFNILRPGIYEISVNPAGDTTVIQDRRGQGEVTGGGSAWTLNPGDVGTFSGTYQLNADVEGLGDVDDFERWSEQRDHHEDVSISARYVSDSAIGYDDLDDNGGWRPVPGYGVVWFPHVAMEGWAPYHYGHWAYIAPWGYTWVDDAPWGFAPFHYGRWINAGGGWGWVPCPPRPVVAGPVYIQPVYAPALVAWIGGPHFGIGIAVGGVGVGWFPLGPREVYVPSYPVSRNYVNNVNVSNTTVNTTVVNNYYTNVVVNKNVNVTNVTYVNQRVPGAVAATTPQAFSSGQPVAHNVVHVDAREVASAPVNALTPPAVPQRAAVLGGRPAASVKPPAAVQARAVVAKTAPPPPPPSFTQRQAAIQSNGGRPLSVAQVRQIAPVRTQTAAAPQVKVAPPAKVVVPPRNVQTQTNKTVSPPNPVAPTRPVSTQPPANVNKPAAQPAATNNPQGPPTAFPVDQRLEQQHLQQSIDLHKQQDQQRQQLEQQQKQQEQQLQKQKAEEARELQQQQIQQQQQLQQQHQQQDQQRQKLELQQKQQEQQLQQQKAEEARQQQLQQQHQQQLQALEKAHEQQQQQLQQKQEAEHQRAEKQQAVKPPPKPAEKPKKEEPPK
jgi:hypothetical protein